MVEHDDGNVNESVDQRIDTKLAEYDHEHDTGISEEEVIALIEEHGSFPEDRLSKLDTLIQRAEETLAAHESSITDVEARLDALEQQAGRRSDEEIRQLIREFVDEHVETGGGMTQAEVEKVVSSALSDLDIQGFDEEVIERVRYHSEALDFPARKVGPAEPDGPYHGASMWGLKFETGRACHIHEATVDAGESGTFTVILGETDGVDKFDQVDSTEIEVDEGVQRVDLDIEVPEAGYWLLTRPSDFPLRRTEFNGWDDYMVDNLRLAHGDKPGFAEESYWYYFFDMEMTASEGHEFPD